MKVLSIQVGRTRTFAPADPDGKRWRSAIAKEPVSGIVALGLEGLAGDVQADRRYHGGPERALLAYAAEHFAGWCQELSRPSLTPGTFGENLTLEGLAEAQACIGDVLSLGGAVIQVSQPRMPCVKLARRLAAPGIVARALATARTGFYLRVLRVGEVARGPLALIERPFPRLTVAAALQALTDPSLRDELVGCPLLAEGWRAALAKRR